MPKNRVLFHQGRNMSSYTSIPSEKLSQLIGTADAPALIDVRTDEDFAADPRLIPDAVCRSHLDVPDWASGMTGQSVVVICNKGNKLAEGTAPWLRCGNVAAEVLEGGHVGWTAAELPSVPADKLPKRDGRGLSFDAPILSSVDLPALALSLAVATAIFRFNVGMLVVLAASCVAGILMRLAGVI